MTFYHLVFQFPFLFFVLFKYLLKIILYLGSWKIIQIWNLILILKLKWFFTLIYGAKLRLKIISYILSPETKLGPINYLILMDQLNGILLATSIVIRIVFIISSTPLTSLFGKQFCKFSNLIGALYIGGSYGWSCFIAVYRVLYIKFQNWMKTQIGVLNLLYLERYIFLKMHDLLIHFVDIINHFVNTIRVFGIAT